MSETTFIYVFAEMSLLLLVVSVFLLHHVRKQKKLIRQFEEKVTDLRDVAGKFRKEAKEAQDKLAENENTPSKDYLAFLEGEVENTRNHHQSLNPDRDIVLDISDDAPIERQAASLRHAFLLAEKEAYMASEEEAVEWSVLQAKLQQIIEFYGQDNDLEVAEPEFEEESVETEEVEATAAEGNASYEELELYKNRVENLERFKHLFFNMESLWAKAKQEAADYQQQLLAMGKELGAGEDFEQIMDNYASSYDGVSDLIVEGGNFDGDNDGATVESKPATNITMTGKQEEMDRLRLMAADQHKVITELKRKLEESDSPEAGQEILQDLSAQLEQQQRFIKETEACTQLLEDELTRIIEENEALRLSTEGAAGEDGSQEEQEGRERVQELMADLTEQSKDMLATISSLEEENKELKEQLESGAVASEEGVETDTEAATALKDKLDEVQQELLNSQTQYIELEERYLELKMKDM